MGDLFGGEGVLGSDDAGAAGVARRPARMFQDLGSEAGLDVYPCGSDGATVAGGFAGGRAARAEVSWPILNRPHGGGKEDHTADRDPGAVHGVKQNSHAAR